MYTETQSQTKGGYWASVSYTVPSTWVRSILSSIWAQEISDRTWTKWKKIIFGADFQGHKVMHKEEAKLFFAYAYLRKTQPYGKLIRANLEAFVNDPQFNRMLEDVLIRMHTSSITGFNLPFFIEQYVGRQVSYSTFYYWSKAHPKLKFSKKRLYNQQEIQQWIDIASKYS